MVPIELEPPVLPKLVFVGKMVWVQWEHWHPVLTNALWVWWYPEGVNLNITIIGFRPGGRVFWKLFFMANQLRLSYSRVPNGN